MGKGDFVHRYCRLIWLGMALTPGWLCGFVDTNHEANLDGENSFFRLIVSNDLFGQWRKMVPHLANGPQGANSKIMTVVNATKPVFTNPKMVHLQHGHAGGHKMIVRSLLSTTPFKFEDRVVWLKDDQKVDIYLEGRGTGLYEDVPGNAAGQGHVRIELVDLSGEYCGCVKERTWLKPKGGRCPADAAPPAGFSVPKCPAGNHGTSDGEDYTHFWMVTSKHDFDPGPPIGNRGTYQYVPPKDANGQSYTNVRMKEIVIRGQGNSCENGCDRCGDKEKGCIVERISLPTTCSSFRICGNNHDGTPACDESTLKLSCAPPDAKYTLETYKPNFWEKLFGIHRHDHDQGHGHGTSGKQKPDAHDHKH